mgnify:CR=1 FL=1
MTMAEFRKFTTDMHDSVELCVSVTEGTISAVKAAEISILVNPDGHRLPVLVVTGTNP